MIRFIYALGIPYIGVQTATLISDACHSDIKQFLSVLYEFRDVPEEEMPEAGAAVRGIVGVGEAVVQALTSLACKCDSVFH